jgi:hypothetical protein
MSKISNPIPESASYDNFLNSKIEYDEDGKLPIDLNFEDENDRDRLWVGMPEFIQDEKKTYKTIYLHFRNEEDFKEFVTKYKSLDTDQVISQKTKSMWYPHLDKDENSLKRYFEDD